MTRKQNEERRRQNWLNLYDERLVSVVFPNVEKIVIEYEVIHKSVFGNQKETHTSTYSPNLQAHFIVKCLNGECTSGYFDLKNVISTMEREKISISEGTLDCKGSEAPDHLYQRCSGTLNYKISIGYK
jgi:hypothetical protein